MAKLIGRPLLHIHLEREIAGIGKWSLPQFCIEGIEPICKALIDETAKSRLIRPVNSFGRERLNYILLAIAAMYRVHGQCRKMQQKLLRPVFGLSRRNTISNPPPHSVRNIGREPLVELAEAVWDDEPIVTHCVVPTVKVDLGR